MGACAALPDDLIVEILSWLPAKSVHRFKCISKTWRDLISNSNHHKRLPQALAGFFYHIWDDNRFPSEARHFTNVSGCIPPLVKPALAFLPNHADIVVLDCCNCLLLCRHKSPECYDYFVCNPATEKWVALPNPGDDDEFFPCCLAFDPDVSLHFHVFLYRETDDAAQVRIYSSRTGRWNHIVRDLSLDGCVSLLVPRSIVFFKGMQHFLTYKGVVIVVDLESKKWKKIELPDVAIDRGWFFLLGQSQGCLWYVAKDDNEYQISFWTLENAAGSFKNSVSTIELLGGSFQPKYCEPVAFHPHCSFLFFTSEENVLMSCDIYRAKARRLFPLGQGDLESFLPYMPCFSGTLADGN